MKRLTIALLLIGLFGVTSGYGQTAQRGQVSVNPCPGGGGTAILETISVPSLESLVQLSELIMVGTVVNLSPASRMNPDHLNLIETTSLISVTEVLSGTLAPGTNTISMSQQGGRVEPCTLLVPEDPLIKSGEEYVLFLVADKRTVPPNTTGSPRYAPVGV